MKNLQLNIEQRTRGRDNDTLHGEAGQDELQGGSGNDGLYGGDDKDSLFGQVTMIQPPANDKKWRVAA